MFINNARNVNSALLNGIRLLSDYGVNSDSRNGPVLVAPHPVVTVTDKPTQRVLSIPGRKENPFFHFMEALWMLRGRNDVPFLTKYVQRMSTYSDDGKTIPGAYGHRWRKHFKFDQLAWAIKRLQADHNDRRVVVSMWDGAFDPLAADRGSKDVPCNTQIYFLISNNQLNMTVMCRSNDAIWGAHGANAVHFSMLMEYMASRIGVEIGTMYQWSNNYHAYVEFFESIQSIALFEEGVVDMYNNGAVPYPMFDAGSNPLHWDEDLDMFLDEPNMVGLRHSFFRRVACPIEMSHRAWRQKDDPDRFKKALEIIEQCAANDWKRACITWLKNSQETFRRANDDGPQPNDRQD